VLGLAVAALDILVGAGFIPCNYIMVRLQSLN